MPRFHFHLCRGQAEVRDAEGWDCADLPEASRLAARSIRAIVARDVQAGVLDLGGQIEIADEHGRALMTVRFREAFEIRHDGR
jgi:hypothetical protein